MCHSVRIEVRSKCKNNPNDPGPGRDIWHISRVQFKRSAIVLQLQLWDPGRGKIIKNQKVRNAMRVRGPDCSRFLTSNWEISLMKLEESSSTSLWIFSKVSVTFPNTN